MVLHRSVRSVLRNIARASLCLILVTHKYEYSVTLELSVLPSCVCADWATRVGEGRRWAEVCRHVLVEVSTVCLCPPLRVIAMLQPRHGSDVSDGGLA